MGAPASPLVLPLCSAPCGAAALLGSGRAGSTERARVRSCRERFRRACSIEWSSQPLPRSLHADARSALRQAGFSRKLPRARSRVQSAGGGGTQLKPPQLQPPPRPLFLHLRACSERAQSHLASAEQTATECTARETKRALRRHRRDGRTELDDAPAQTHTADSSAAQSHALICSHARTHDCHCGQPGSSFLD